METIFSDFESLSNDELILTEGGIILSSGSFGSDVGYALGWILSAMGKGASKVRG